MTEEQATTQTASTPPTFSVIVASNRGPDRIRRCLAGLAAQDYPRDRYEVVAVDDGGPAGLAAVAAELGRGMRVVVHEQANAGPARARNAGARRAAHRYLAFTDDDCCPAPGWLRGLAEVLAEHPDALIGGTVLNSVPHDRFAEATHCLIAFLADAFGDDSPRRFFTSNNLAVAREAFATVGGFDESFPVPGGEDRELCERWQSQGRPLVAAPGAVVLHAHSMTLREFVRQHRNYGRGAYELRRRRTADDGALSPEPPGFYVRLVADPFRRLPVTAALSQSALLAITQVATALGYFGEWRRSRR